MYVIIFCIFAKYFLKQIKMKKVTDLKENECIHCPKKEDFEAILKLNPKNDLSVYVWEVEKENTVYYPYSDNQTGVYANLDYAKENSNPIHPASEFLQPTYQLTKEQLITIAENGSVVKELFPEVFATPNDVIKVIETYGKDKLITLIEAYNGKD